MYEKGKIYGFSWLHLELRKRVHQLLYQGKSLTPTTRQGNQLPCKSDLLTDYAKVYKTMRAAIDNDEEFHSDLFEKASLMSNTVDKENILTNGPFWWHTQNRCQENNQCKISRLIFSPITQNEKWSQQTWQRQWLPYWRGNMTPRRERCVGKITSPLGTISSTYIHVYIQIMYGFISPWNHVLSR